MKTDIASIFDIGRSVYFVSETGKWCSRFVFSAGCVLIISGLAKVISSFGHARIGATIDPIFSISFSHLMLSIGILELGIASLCLAKSKTSLSLVAVAWLSAGFLAYRFGLWMIGWQRPCACLGNLTDVVHVSPQTADLLMKLLLAYMLIGSFASLVYGRKSSKLNLLNNE